MRYVDHLHCSRADHMQPLIGTLIDFIKRSSQCQILPAQGLPSLPEEYALPDDLRFFYQACGGAEIFTESGFMIRIVSPEALILTNTVIFGNMALEARTWEELNYHPSRSWHRVAQGDGETQYVSIDLARIDAGICYDSHWVNHPGNSQTVAHSFTEFLYRTIIARGKRYYWTA